MPEAQQHKRLFNDGYDLEAAARRTRDRGGRPRRTGVSTFSIPQETKAKIKAAAALHDLKMSDLVRDALKFRTKQLLDMPPIVGRNELIQSDDEYELARQREELVDFCCRLDFATSERIEKAKDHHKIRFEIQIVRPALRDYAEALLKLPKANNS